MRLALLIALLLTGCDTRHSPVATSAGKRLETAASVAGLVVDPATASEVGSWAREGDRLCVVPVADGTERIGALVDYGERQGCIAAGTVIRSGERLDVKFGECHFAAHFDGDRIVFPATLPAACDRLCTGRASLAALSVARISGASSEARTLRSPHGKALCEA